MIPEVMIRYAQRDIDILNKKIEMCKSEVEEILKQQEQFSEEREILKNWLKENDIKYPC